MITPNLPEAEALGGMPIADVEAMRRAGEALLTLGVPAVLLKGGHLPGDTVVDVLATGGRDRGIRGAADRHPPHPRDGLHASERGRSGAGAGNGIAGSGRAGARLCPRGDRARRRGSAPGTAR